MATQMQIIAGKKQGFTEFCHGLRQGIPIALGYIPVSFTFGLMAVGGGIPVWTAILISMSNLTSAGQFAGTNLIIANAPLLEIGLTTFVINIRYMLMSLSLSQKITPGMALLKRCIMAFGITDETFAVASMEKGEITFNYFIGLVTCPYWGWALGTAMGALTSSVLPKAVQSCMGIALYAMFIALVVPAAKRSRAAFFVAAAAIGISSFFRWGPYANHISSGWSIIIATIIASFAGAVIYPKEEDELE
ncbi:MAG: AzlC family ABC transporter permease [Tepidanaerobacteraceae bacterium]|nr:AzlC family ABC transporter permease [Tepidanaerobacteraceae bacterium]